MRKVRARMFETNSSMEHVLCICTEDEFAKFENGDLIWDRYRDRFIEKVPNDGDEWEYMTYDEWQANTWYENFEEHLTTTDGHSVVAFGYYGHD